MPGCRAKYNKPEILRLIGGIHPSVTDVSVRGFNAATRGGPDVDMAVAREERNRPMTGEPYIVTNARRRETAAACLSARGHTTQASEKDPTNRKASSVRENERAEHYRPPKESERKGFLSSGWGLSVSDDFPVVSLRPRGPPSLSSCLLLTSCLLCLLAPGTIIPSKLITG